MKETTNYYDHRKITGPLLAEEFEKAIGVAMHRPIPMAPTLESYVQEFALKAIRGAMLARLAGAYMPQEPGTEITALKSMTGIMILEKGRRPDSIVEGQNYVVKDFCYLPIEGVPQRALDNWHVRIREGKHPLQTWPCAAFSLMRRQAVWP